MVGPIGDNDVAPEQGVIPIPQTHRPLWLPGRDVPEKKYEVKFTMPEWCIMREISMNEMRMLD